MVTPDRYSVHRYRFLIDRAAASDQKGRDLPYYWRTDDFSSPVKQVPPFFMPCHFLNVYPFVHLFRTGAILTVNDSVTLTVILLLLWLFQVSHPAVHLPRNSRESVPGVFPCRPPGTEIPQKRVRCLFPPSTWHGFSAKACQVSLPAVHLARFLCKSVSGSTSCCPPATESPRKRSRCPFPLPTWHGIPAKAFQVSHPAVHLPRFSCESVPGVLLCRPPATESP